MNKLKSINSVKQFFSEYTTSEMKDIILKINEAIKDKEDTEAKLLQEIDEREKRRLNVIHELKLLGEPIPENLKHKLTLSSYLISKSKKVNKAEIKAQYALEVNGKVRKWNGLNKKPDWFKQAVLNGVSEQDMSENAKKLYVE